MDYPQRLPGSDRWAIWWVIPANEDVYRTTLDFMRAKPAEDRVICYEGTYGMHRGLHAWSARVRPKLELRRIRGNGGHEVWVEFGENTERWSTPYSDIYSN